jgi:hypothetical protein
MHYVVKSAVSGQGIGGMDCCEEVVCVTATDRLTAIDNVRPSGSCEWSYNRSDVVSYRHLTPFASIHVVLPRSCPGGLTDAQAHCVPKGGISTDWMFCNGYCPHVRNGPGGVSRLFSSLVCNSPPDPRISTLYSAPNTTFRLRLTRRPPNAPDIPQHLACFIRIHCTPLPSVDTSQMPQNDARVLRNSCSSSPVGHTSLKHCEIVAVATQDGISPCCILTPVAPTPLT